MEFSNILDSLSSAASNVIGAVNANKTAAADQSSSERLAAQKADNSKLITYGLFGLGGVVLLVVVVMLFRRK